MQGYEAWIDGSISPPFSIAAPFLLLASAWLGGRLLTRLLPGARLRNPFLDFVLHCVVGLNCWSLLALLMGFRGWLGFSQAKIVLLVFGVPSLLFAILKLTSGAKIPCLLEFLKKNWLFALFALAGLLLMLGEALAPPMGILMDEQIYQLPVPFRWLADGFPKVYSDIPYSGYPLQPEFLFSLVMGLGKLGAPRILCLCVQFFNFCCLYILLRRRCGPFSSTVLVLALFSASAHLSFSGECFVEPFTSLYFLAGLAIVEEPGLLRRRAPQAASLLGLIAGALAASKLTSVPTGAMLGVGVALFAAKSVRGRFKACALFAIGSLYAIPFFLRPLFETGNPVYPYFSWLFGGSPALDAMSLHYHFLGGIERYGGDRSLSGLLLSPFHLAFGNSAHDCDWGFQFPLLFLLCLALPFFLWLRRPRAWRSDLFFVFSVFALYVFWLFSAPQARFLAPVFVLMILLSGRFLGPVKGAFRKIVLGLLTLAVAAFLVQSPMFLKYKVQYWIFAARGLSPSERVKAAWKRSGLFEAYSKLAEASSPQEKAMLVFERRTLYCPRPFAQATPLCQPDYFTPLPKGSDAEIEKAVREAIARSGATKILLNTSFDEAWPKSGAEDLSKLLNAFSRLRDSGFLKALWYSRNFVLLSTSASDGELKRRDASPSRP